jgi:5-methylcytosine-specific restriction endonuclease McrA
MKCLITDEGRECTRCGVFQSWENFYVVKNKTAPHGRASRCRSCSVEAVIESRKKNPEAYQQYQHSEKEIARKKEWAANNPEYYQEYQRKWQKDNKDKVSVYNRAAYERSPEKYLEYHQAWRDAHREEFREMQRKFYARHPDRMAVKGRTWRLKNPELVTHYSRLRRARKRANGGDFTLAEWTTLKEKYHYTCLRCSRTEPEIRLVPDHVVPLVKGGANDINNIQPLCAKCNGWKHSKTIDYRV